MLNANINVNVFSVKDADGNCDVEATKAKFAAYLVEYSTSVKADNDTIKTLIDSVFDQAGNKDKECLPLQYVINNVVGKLDAGESVDAFNMAVERVGSFIKESGLFASKKGPKGGLHRLAAVAPKAEEKAA